MKHLTHQVIDHERTAFFDRLAESWDTFGKSPAATSVESFLSKLKLGPGGTILDVGTGTGMLIPYLFQYEPTAVYALDLSRIMLTKLARKFDCQFSDRLILVQGDVHCLEFTAQLFDAVICNGVYPHFRDKPLALAELYRVLKPGGVMAINHFAGRDFINFIHGGSNHELIRGDLLEPVADLADRVCQAGFLVRETVDNETEYYLIAEKP